MPRNMSFALTTEQFLNRTKDVTRRLGWGFLKPADLLWGVKQAMGLKKGESIERLGLIKVVSIRKEPLSAITPDDVIREGFPDWSSQEFIAFFAEHNRVDRDALVNRIEFVYMDVPEQVGGVLPVNLESDGSGMKKKQDETTDQLLILAKKDALLRFSLVGRLIVPRLQQPSKIPAIGFNFQELC